MTLIRPIALCLALAHCLLALPMSTPAAAAAASAVGVWRTPLDQGLVEIMPCGVLLCGRIVSSTKITADPRLPDSHNHDPKLKTRPLKGLMLLAGFHGGPLRWDGGRIYNPEDGNLYDAHMRLESPDALKVEGCVLMILCKAQVWRRVR